MKKLTVIIFLFSSLFLQAQISVSLSENLEENNTKVIRHNNDLEVTWQAENSEYCQLKLNLEKSKPLFNSIAMGQQGQFKEIAANVDPVFTLNVGKRTLKKENGWTIFFDKVPTRPYKSYVLDFDKNDVKVTKHGKRTVISLNELNALDFKGNLEITIYNGIPLFNIAAVVSTQKDSTAILYDAGLVKDKPWETVSFANTDGKIERYKTSSHTSSINQAVKYRTIMGHNTNGSMAVFPPPHQYFYPLDEAYNLKSVWYGSGYRDLISGYGIGIRHEPEGDHRYVPWFNAPPNTAQRLNFFCLLSTGQSEQALENVKKYTHDDKYVPLEGHKTMSSHFHNEFIMKVVLANKPVPEKPEFVDVFKSMGVDIVHLGEFHYTAHPKGPDEVRLKELNTLFNECERLSDNEFLLLPGEEPNEFFGGHWMSFFPKPIYWIMSRDNEKPYVSEDPNYGKVYRIGNKEEMLQLMETEKGLSWTAHPRIKGSTGYPDKYKDETFFKSDYFLGGAWKAMPADLSTPKLGLRVLGLLDDMNNWGAKKKIIAEADLFTITLENEMYAHMNVNYLKMDNLPKFKEGWQPILDAMQTGNFFSTTGEILIPSFTINGKKSGETVDANVAEVEVKIDWTYPLNFVEIISGDGENIYRDHIDLNDTDAFGSQVFKFQTKLKKRTWARLEVWDVAANGAFTQTIYLND
tara:strand:- start:36341 stop:38410 length:2070 start_codon:yes stop_codon:yes gene_type:complete